MEINLDNLKQLYQNPEYTNYTNIFLCVTYPNDLGIKILRNYNNNKKSNIYLMFNSENKIFEKITLTDKHVFYDTIECQSLTDLIKTLREKLDDYIKEKQRDIKYCNKYIKEYENCKDIIINGKTDNYLKIKYNLDENINNSAIDIVKEEFKVNNLRFSVYLDRNEKTYQFDDNIAEIDDKISNILKSGFINYADSMIKEYNSMFPLQRVKISKYNDVLKTLQDIYVEIFI